MRQSITFADLLGEYMKQNDYTPGQLARRANIPKPTIVNWLNGVVEKPRSWRRLIAIATILNLREAEVGRLLQAAGHPPLAQLLAHIRSEEERRLFSPWLQERPAPSPATPSEPLPVVRPDLPRHWGDAPDGTNFHGRQAALAQLSAWLIEDRCRLVGIVGLGGIGKTSLAARLAGEVAGQFDCLLWYSLRDGPSLQESLAEAIRFFSNQPEPTLPDQVNRLLLLLLDRFRTDRCLWILDNMETVLEEGEKVGQYRIGYEGYGDLLRRVGECDHRSCLVVTGREKPEELVRLSGSRLPVRILPLEGVNLAEGRAIWSDMGLSASETEMRALLNRYSGNPLALKLAAEPVRELFGGETAAFLRDGEPFAGGIGELLEQHISRLSTLEMATLYWLAIEREPTSADRLRANLMPPVSRRDLQEALVQLRRRSLIEQRGTGFALPNLILDYMTGRLIDRFQAELIRGEINLLRSHALVQAQAKEYIRLNQVRFILTPLVVRLLDSCRSKEAVRYLLERLLAEARQWPLLEQGYTGGNIIHLLAEMGLDLTGLDFSGVAVRQADLRERRLQAVNFSGADLSGSIFADTFHTILSLAISPRPAERLLAAGTVQGEVRLWRLADGKPLLSRAAHSGWVWDVAFSPAASDNPLLASCSSDGTIRLWRMPEGRCVRVLTGHKGWVWAVAFSPDGQTLVSGGDDKTVRRWDVASGECVAVLTGHTGAVNTVACNPAVTAPPIASGSTDGTIRLWQSDGRCQAVLQDHTDRIWSVAFSPAGQRLVSGGDDHTVRLWDTVDGQPLRVLQGHTQRVMTVTFSPDGRGLVSGGFDNTIRLWTETGQCLKILSGHTNGVWATVFDPEPGPETGDHALLSGGDDKTIRWWDTGSGRCWRRLRGYTNWIWSVAYSPEGRRLATGSEDHLIRIWDAESGHCLKQLEGHTGQVWEVAFSPDGQALVSGGDDAVVRIWDLASGSHRTLEGHTDRIHSVRFSPDGRFLASSSADGVIYVWAVESGQPLRSWQNPAGGWLVAFSPDGRLLAGGDDEGGISLWDPAGGRRLKRLTGHAGPVWTVAFSPDTGQGAEGVLASGSFDGTVKLWDVASGQPLHTLTEHTEMVWAVTFSPDGSILASGSHDQTIRLWDSRTGESLRVLIGHSNRVTSLAFSPDGRWLVSGSGDETIRVWDVASGESMKTLQPSRPYEGMRVKGTRGLTEAQIASLKALGAVAGA